ncbi:MAG: hypothetical protein M3280_05675 [Actinomycetota bacterium]|nr:hypothetical protein [Actinomycetota bacterium]
MYPVLTGEMARAVLDERFERAAKARLYKRWRARTRTEGQRIERVRSRPIGDRELRPLPR